jgi:hypothetical protein
MRPPWPLVSSTLLVGIPASLLLMTLGCVLCLTVIGFPAGLVCFGLGFKVLAIDSPRGRSFTCGADRTSPRVRDAALLEDVV